MAGKHLTAVFFKNASGNEPARDFLRSLPIEDRRVIGRDIAAVEYGWPVGLPTCRALGKGLWEVRSSLPSRREARVFFYTTARQEMVLLHAIVKKSRATLLRDIRLAEERMNIHRNKEENQDG